MIKIENTEVFGWDAAIRGMRNPLNSWIKSDSYWTHVENPKTLNTAKFQFFLGDCDLKLMQTLCKAGSDHGKFLRMIDVTVDITAPLYWWKEFDTYKVGTVANSCSTMHKIQAKEFTLDDFSHEHLFDDYDRHTIDDCDYLLTLEIVIDQLNDARDMFINTKDIKYWWQMIQLLPSSYNQKRTVQLNYEVLRAIDRPGRRKDHKLDEWRDFCKWTETLPYFKEICLND